MSLKLLKRGWLVLMLSGITLAWFVLFRTKPVYSWGLQEIIIEAICLFALITGYVYIAKLKIRNLSIGWGLFTAGMLVHLLSQFIYQPKFIGIELKGIIAVIGLILIVDGFYRTFNRVKEAEEKYRILFDNSPDFIAQVDEKGRFLTANLAMAKSLGIKREDLIGKSFFEVMPEEVAKKRLKMGRRVVEERKIRVFEDWRQGRCFHNIYVPIPGQRSFQVIARDITSQKKTEEQLKESKRKYKVVTDNSTSGIYIFQDGKLVFVNKAMVCLSGYKEEELLSMNYLDLVHPNYRDKLKRMTEQALTGNISGLPSRFEFKAIRKDGKERWIEAAPAIIEYEGRPAILGNIRDITEQKELEEALRRSERSYRTLVENIQEGLGITDPDENFVFVNNAACSILGYSKDELVGMNLIQLVPPHDLEKILRETEKRKQGKKTIYEIKMRRKDGKLRDVRVSAIPLYDKSGAFAGTIGMFWDITERKQAEKRMENLTLLYKELGKAVNQSETINEFSGRILRILNNVIDYDMADILVYESEENALVESAQIGYPRELEERTIKRQKVGRGERRVAAFSVFHKKAIYIDNMKENELTQYSRDLVEKFDLSEMYAVPLMTRGNLRGVLQVIVKSGKTLSRENRQLLDIISEEIAAGIAKIKAEEELRNIAIRDYLTGLYNHRYFYEKLEEEKGRNERYKEFFSLLYLDIDDFKVYNDTYGHIEGDKILKTLGKVLRRCLRKMDSAYRYGGDEFVVLLPHTYKDQAKKVAERIREEIRRELYPIHKITVSIGVADSRTSEDVIKAADRAMYEAKREGKDRVKVAGESE